MVVASGRESKDKNERDLIQDIQDIVTGIKTDRNVDPEILAELLAVWQGAEDC